MLKAQVIGNLGADVEVRDVNGSKFAVLRVAHTEYFTDPQGHRAERTMWIDVNYQRVDSAVMQYLVKGTKIYAEGNFSVRVYSSPKDRCMKAGVTLYAQYIELVGGSRDHADNPGQTSPQGEEYHDDDATPFTDADPAPSMINAKVNTKKK